MIDQSPIQQDRQSLALLEDSSGLLIRTPEEAVRMAQILIVVKQPATTAEISTQAVLVLHQYYVAALSDDMQAATARLWVTELRGYPNWAIERAVQFWIGRENPEKRRRRKPLPGDIGEQTEAQMWRVRSLERHIGWWEKYRGDYPAFFNDKRVDIPN